MINMYFAADVVIPPSANISERVTIAAGTLLTEGLIIGTDVVIDRGVIFAGDSTSITRLAPNVRVGAGAVIGANVEIGWGAQVLPGSVVFSSVPANAIVSGNPAQIVGYTKGIAGATVQSTQNGTFSDRRQMLSQTLNVGGAALLQMPRISDLRGNLSVGEIDDGFPFIPKRYFIVFGVPSEELRGEHAHKECQQILVCVHGSCRALIDDGTTRSEVILDRPDLGLHMPAMIWGTQYRYTKDAVLLVFASHFYDSSDYLRTYDEFRDEVNRRKIV